MPRKEYFKDRLIIASLLTCTVFFVPLLAEGLPREAKPSRNAVVIQSGLSLSHPVSNVRISQRYDNVRCGVGNAAYHHTGIDYGGDEGTNTDIFAAGDGTVIDIPREGGSCGGPTGRQAGTPGNNHGLGNTVIIQHDTPSGPIYTMYSHLSRILVSVNQPVVRGRTIIGKMGEDCTNGGIHLHFELKSAPVVGNPSGTPCGKKTCADRSGFTCYGYAKGTSASDFGYLNPLDFIGSAAGCSNGASVSRINGSVPVHPDGTLIKVSGAEAVYVIQGGRKRVIPSADRLRGLYGNGGFEFEDVVTVSSDELRSYADGPEVTNALPATANNKTEPPGRLIKPIGGSASPQEIAIVTAGGGRLVFPSSSVFRDLGFKDCRVKPVSDYDSYAPVEGVITGTGGGNLPDDFSIRVDPPLDTVDPGDTVDFTIITSTLSGRPQPINLRVDGLPNGATPLFSSNPVMSGNTTVLHISTSTSTPLASYLITITGTGSRTHQQTLTLDVTDANQGQLTVSSSLTLTPARPHTVGQTLTASFSVTNRGTKKAKIDTLLAGGRLNGDNSCAGGCPDFSAMGPITVKPGKTVNYTGTQMISRAGDYVFFVAYKPHGKDWVTNVARDAGVRNSLSISVDSAGTGNPVISTTSPTNPVASHGNQLVTVIGTNFEPGLDVTVTFPNGQSGRLSGPGQIQNVRPDSFTMVINFSGVPGRYTIQVNNPGNRQSNAYSFNAAAESLRIDSITPSNPLVAGDDQPIRVTGVGFQLGLTVGLTFPGGSGGLSGSQIQEVTSTSFIMRIRLGGPGSWSIQVTNPGGSQSNVFQFNVQPSQSPAPVINQLTTTPNPPVTGQAFTITLTGSNFSPSNSTILFSGPGCSTPCSINATGSSTQVSGQAILAAGTFNVTVRNNSTGLTSNAVSLSVSSAPTAPVINQISTSPSPPITGQAFTITLTGTNFAPSNSTVFFSGPSCSTPCSINASGSSTQVSGQAILAAGTFSVTLRNNTTGLTSNTVQLTVSSSPTAPVINQISTSPNPPITGQAFTITLTGSNFSGSSSTIFFSGPGCSTPCSINATGSSTQVSGQAILAAGTFSVTVRNNSTGLTSNAVSLTVSSSPTAPVINQISTSPNPPITGQAFTITLIGTNFAPSNSTVFFSGPGCSTPCSISASGSSTQVSGQAILAAGNFSVTLRNNTTGLTSNAVQLTVANAPNPPVINQISTSPNPPVTGQAFTITLTGSNFSRSSSTIFFSGPGCSTPCSINAAGTSTQVSGQAILAAGTFSVTVRNNTTGLTSSPASLTVSNAPNPPVINQISTSPNPPITGQAFTITLTGSNFSGSNSTVFFSGPGCSTPCSISASGSSTQVSGQAILAAGTFSVTVRNNSTGLTSNAVPLTVSSGTPTISGMTRSPNPPVHGQPFNFTITGTNFNTSNAEVFFRGPGCPTDTSCVVTGLTRTATQLSGAAVLAAGSFTVQVRNGAGGTPSNMWSFNVN